MGRSAAGDAAPDSEVRPGRSVVDGSEAGSAMLAAVRDLVDAVVLPNVMAWDRDDVLPVDVLSRLGQIGVPGALVPPQYRGPGMPVVELVDVWRTLSQGWISLAGAINTTALATALLLRHGTVAQRER